MLVEDVHLSFCGWNTSTLFRLSIPLEPPTTNSSPSTTAVPTPLRGCFMGATMVHVSISGLYISTLSKLCPLQPPTANTRLFRTATPTIERGVFMGETCCHRFDWLLYRSTEARSDTPLYPPKKKRKSVFSVTFPTTAENLHYIRYKLANNQILLQSLFCIFMADLPLTPCTDIQKPWRCVVFKGEVLWGFWPLFLKNGEKLSYKIILEQREERIQLNTWKEHLLIYSSAFWKQKCENLKKISLSFFKFQSIAAYSVSE